MVTLTMTITIMIATIVLDTLLGGLRALKEHSWNSSVGINGAIRKIAMFLSVICLLFIDNYINIDLMSIVPNEIKSALALKSVGLSDFFSILFALYETCSILKNMLRCGLPVPKAIRKIIEKFLNTMTDELPNDKK